MEEVDLDSDFGDRPAESSADQKLAAVSRELHQASNGAAAAMLPSQKLRRRSRLLLPFRLP